MTLYQDGKPLDVVVDGKQRLADGSNSDQVAGAGQEEMQQGPSFSLWPAVYEQAYAVATESTMSELDLNLPEAAGKVLTGAYGAADIPPQNGATFAANVDKTPKKGEGAALATKDYLSSLPDSQINSDGATGTVGDGQQQAKG